MARALALALPVLCLQACALAPGRDVASVAPVAPTPASAATDSAAGPSAALPSLRLAPAALGRSLALQQRVQARFPAASGGVETREAVTLLEVDARQVRLAALASGQVLARLTWDGKTLDTWRAPWAPAQLAPERVLDDLQLALWPSAAVASALPAGWTIEADARRRVLRYRQAVVTEVTFPSADTIVISQHRVGYVLTITTLATGALQP